MINPNFTLISEQGLLKKALVALEHESGISAEIILGVAALLTAKPLISPLPAISTTAAARITIHKSAEFESFLLLILP